MIPTQLTDADKGVDFTEAIQGHVGQSTKQLFTEERSRVLHNRKLNLECRESIVKDQFGNVYVVFTAHLADGEVYAVTNYVEHPSKGILSKFRSMGFTRFSDDLLAWLQDEAFVAFGRETLAILKGRQAAKLPMVHATPSGLDLPGVLGANPLSA